MRKEESKAKKVIAFILILLIANVIYGGLAYIRGKAIRDICVFNILITVGTGITLFSLVQSALQGALHYDNSRHYMRFARFFILNTIAGGTFVFVPCAAWVFPGIALALSFFSGAVTGITAYSVILAGTVYLAGENFMTFMLYFLMGIAFVVLFDGLDKDYKTGFPFAISFVLYTVALSANVIFKNRGIPELEQFIIPTVNLFVTMIITLASLKMFCSLVIDKERSRYIVLNDQESELLAKYKQQDPEMYFNAIHTAYFAEKFARLRNLDSDLAKNGGYYHKVILNECKNNDKSLIEVCDQYHFPESAFKLLQEYCYKSEKLSMRETAVVYLADAVVTSLLYVIENEENKGKTIDYGKVAAAVVKRKINSGELDQSEFTLKDITEMEKMFIGEKLYYDFLRRE